MPAEPGPQALHANLMRVAGRGVLLRGSAGRGKSRLGLELLAAGEQLVADDLVHIERRGAELFGRAGTTRPQLCIRGAGILDVTALYGAAAVHPGDQRIDWVVDLDPAPPACLPVPARVGILGVQIPCLQLNPGQPNVALIQAACRLGVTALQAWQSWQPEVIDGQGT